MGPIQSSINSLIFQTALIKSFKENKAKQAEAEEKAKVNEERKTELYEKNKEVI